MTERDVLVLLLVAAYGALLTPIGDMLRDLGRERWGAWIRVITTAGLLMALIAPTYRVGLAAVTVGFLATLFAVLTVLNESRH